jgi:hypothetical protein
LHALAGTASPPEWAGLSHCGHSERRLFRAQGHFPAYRCRACNGYYTLLTGTVFAKTRQRIQANLNDTAPTAVMLGTAFEADELYQKAGEKKHAPS